MLEPYEAKVSCTVLKGLEAGNGLRLLDREKLTAGYGRSWVMSLDWRNNIHQIEGNTDAMDSTDTHGFGVSDSNLSIC